MRSFLRVLGFARHHAGWVAVALVSMTLVAAATVFAYNLVRPVYDELLGTPAPATTAAETALRPGGIVTWLDQLGAHARQRLGGLLPTDRTALLSLVVLAVGVKNLFAFLSHYASARLGLATVRDLRERLFESLLGQSAGYFNRTSSGELIARVVNDVQLVNEALAERLGDLLQDAFAVLVLSVYALSLDPVLALGTVAVAPLLLAPVAHFSRRLRRWSRQAQEQMGELTVVLDETLRGMRIVQAFGVETFAAGRFKAASRRHFLASLKARAIQAANAPVMEVAGAVGAMALVAYASASISAGTMTIGDFSAFLIAVYGAYNPVKRLNKFNLALQQAEVAAQRVLSVIDEPVEIRDRPGARELDGLGDGVRLDGVSFAYRDDQPVLSDVDIHILPGATVALVGPSGAGKSTVAQLIPRFLDVDRGAVLIGGHDVRDVTLRSLRAHIALVTQETVLFNDTVRANIALGREETPQAAVESAARAAYAHGFISALPDGYDTVIGQGGARLSGGERQRLAIARALLKDAPILILDEATSALDPEAEGMVQRALANLMQGRTTLVIAHRLSTIRRADTIVVLDGGRVVDQGTHEQLMSRAGLYRRLVEAQEHGPAGHESNGGAQWSLPA